MLSVRPKQFSRTAGSHRMAGRIEVREPYDDQREQPALPYQGPRAHEQGQVGAEVAQGRAVAQQHDPELAGIVVPVDGEVPVQADRPGDHGGQRGGPGRPELPSAPDLVDHIDRRSVGAELRSGVRVGRLRAEADTQ